jgi:hypothetical protein
MIAGQRWHSVSKRRGGGEMRIVLAAALVATLIAIPSLASQSESNAVGEFCGTYSNGTKYQDMKTEFRLNADGQLFGVYEFEDNGKWESGSLDPTLLNGDRSGRFIWRDKYGSGVLILQFRADYSSFSGAWSREQEPVLDWNGKRRCPDKGSV